MFTLPKKGPAWIKRKIKESLGRELSDEDALQLLRLMRRFQRILYRMEHEARLRRRVKQSGLFDL